jgi:ankyrin repeat protein
MLIWSLLFAWLQVATSDRALSKSYGPPSFFLQDPSDGLCLAGDKYARCGLNSLWYVQGKPGQYQIHHRLVDENDIDSCLDKEQCHLDESEVKLGSCNHCGAKKWNIVGDANSGYVLTQDKNKHCLKRVGDRANMIKCDRGYSSFSLQFVTKDDITTMSSDGARLIQAALDNDLAAVKNFIENEGIEVNVQDWDNTTALMVSSTRGHMDVVKYLLSKKADVTIVDKDNVNAFMEAARGGHLEVLKLLVSAYKAAGVSKADLIAQSATSGMTALWLATGEGHGTVVSYLLELGFDPNIARHDGISALMVASAGGHQEAVKILLEAGAIVAGRDKDGITALISAAENGSLPIVQMLLENGADVDEISDAGFSPLIIAAANGHTSIARVLLEHRASVAPPHPENVTALMYAAAGGHVEMVEMLLQHGANVNARHNQGGTALLEAVTAGNVSVVELLLAAGADPLVMDEDGVTTLMSAASQGHSEVCRLLLNPTDPAKTPAVDVNAIALSGGTAIMFAAGGGHLETTRLLLQHGADVDIIVTATPEYIEKVAAAIAEGREDVEPHKDGVNALMVAAQGGYLEVVKLLIEEGHSDHTAKDDEDLTAFTTALKGGHLEVALYLLRNDKADPNEIYTDDKSKVHASLLIDSVENAQVELALALIEKGANVSYADADGVTVLTQAAYQGLTEVVAALLALDSSRGVDVAATNVEGVNALIAASSEGHVEIVQMLIQVAGTDVNARDKDGTTALMAAAVRGHYEVVSLLLKAGVDINAQNVDGHTALMFAYNGKNQVETLLDKYAEYLKDAQDANSTKIIQDALKTHVNVVQTLIVNGADETLKDNEGHVAVDFDYKPAEEVLRSASATAALNAALNSREGSGDHIEL